MKPYPFLRSGFVDEQRTTCFSVGWILGHPGEAGSLVWRHPGLIARFLVRHPRHFVTGRPRSIQAMASLDRPLPPRAEQIQASLLAAVAAHRHERA
jgi:hypothetical protein